jgi:hypothetical protein
MTASDYDLGRQTHSPWSDEDSASRHICTQGAYKDRLWEAFKEALGVCCSKDNDDFGLTMVHHPFRKLLMD